MKICVIGNSHLGMLAAAYLEGPPKGAEFVFWGRPGLKVTDARFDGPVLVAEESELKSRLAMMGTDEALDLSKFDCVVLVAMSVSAFAVSGLLTAHRVFGWPGTEPLMAEGPEPMVVPMISQSALHASLVAKSQRGTAYGMVKRLRAVSDCPVVIVPQPFPSVRALDVEDKYHVFKRVQRNGEGAQFAQCLQAALCASFKGFSDVTVIEPANRAHVHGFLTKKKFTRGAVRFNPDAKQPQRDILHANAGLGHIMMRRVLDAVRPAD